MPLFPIAEPQAAAVGDDPEPDENRLHLESEVQPIAERANEGWLQVGRSYNAAPVGQEQNSAASHDAVASEVGATIPIQASSGTSRPKAADFFDATVRVTSSTAGERYRRDESPEQGFAHLSYGKGNRGRAIISSSGKARKKKRKRTSRHSSPSDEDSDSSGHAKPRSGRQHSSKERVRSRKKDGKISRKSRKKSNRRSSRGRRIRGSDSSGSDESSDEDISSRRRRTNSPDSSVSQLFVEDRRGDQDTLSFGGFYRLDVPLYHGANAAARRREIRGKGGSMKAERYFGKQAISANSDGHLARVQLWKGDKRKDHATKWTNTLALRGTSTAEGAIPAVGDREDTRQTQQQQKGGTDFLPVDAVVMSAAAQSDMTENAEQEGVHMESLERWVTRRTKEFNVITRERPGSEDLWLQFSDFQEEAVRAVHGGGHALLPTSAAVVRITQEKRASVLEAALQHNPQSVRLRLAHLHLADQLQEHDVVDSLWKGAIEKSNHSQTLWLRYLQFKAGHFASFSVPNRRSAYAVCLQALRSQREETRKAQVEEHKAKGVFIMGGRSMLGDRKDHMLAEKELLEVIWSYCMMERAAGYEERVLGVLQALVELNVQPGSTVSMGELESFWDSEAPRIGDAHPCLSGLMPWREAERAAKAKSREQATGAEQEHVVPARKLPVLKSPGLRGKRKRAVDFFNDELLAATVQVPLNGGVSSPLTQAKAQESEQGGSKGNPGSDVLEKAYHAAMALAATAQTSHTDDVPTPRPKYASDDDALPKISDSHLDEKLSLLRSPRGSTRGSETSLEDTVSAKPPEMSSAVPHDASGRMESTRKGNATTFMDEGTRAVDAEGLIWVDKSEATAYSVRHGYRIDVQGAQDSVSGLEYGRILNQMRGGDATEGNAERDVEAAAAASKRLRNRGDRERDAEIAKQAAALEDVGEGDEFSSWAEKEDALTRHQWQPIRSTVDAEEAEDRPDRVVFIEDLRPFIFSLAQPASLCTLVSMLLSAGGLVFPRSEVSHSPKLISEAYCAASFGDGGLSSSLISAVSNGLQAVWSASGGDLPVEGQGVIKCTGRQGSCLPPLVVSTAADQFLLLTNEVARDVSRQTFIRNVLHHLIRAPESLTTVDAKASVSSDSSGDILVQLQCTLIMFEGLLASAAGARHGRNSDPGNPSETTESKGRSVAAWSDEDVHGHEARKVAKSLLEASQASAMDLRLWSSYVQLLALLGSRLEAIKVAEKALSMVQALPENKKVHSAELFWLTFRLHAGLPLSPRDPHAGVDIAPEKSVGVGDLFERNEKQGRATREMALLVLCSFAEGSFKRRKTKKSKRDGKGSSSDAACATPPRLMTARKLMAAHVARIATEQLQEGAGVDTSDRLEGALDMTPSFMYYSVAWVWLEFLTIGQEAADEAMAKCLGLAQSVPMPTDAGGTAGASVIAGSVRLGGTLQGNRPYTWDVTSDHISLGVCLERMHRAFSELLVLAQRYNPVETGPRKVREVLLRGLQSFPAEPGMLCLLLDAEEFSGSQQRLVHHFFEVSRRRALAWGQGPTPIEWIFFATHQVMRCVREARQTAITRELDTSSIRAVAPATSNQADTTALRVKSWLPGSYARLKRFMESAVTHPSGRRVPMLWRMYMSLEAMRGNHIQAKHLFWRAIHACPGNKAVWMDALRGHRRARIGAAGLRPAFPTKELNEILDAILEKALHLRVEPP